MDALHRSHAAKMYQEMIEAETDAEYWERRAKYLAFCANNSGYSYRNYGFEQAAKARENAKNGTPRPTTYHVREQA